ncbi:MAG: tetratricopeptide repeat protein [Gammaproteobacteria bacterium]
MNRFIATGMLLAAVQCAHAAGSVPDSVLKDIHDGYFHRALAALQPQAATHAQDAEFQYQLGTALLGTHSPDAALAAFKAAIAIAPNDGRYHRGLGEAYCDQAEKASMFKAFGLAKSCLAGFQDAVKLAPDDVDSRVSLADYYMDAPGIAGGSMDKAHAEEAALDKLDKLQALQVRAQEADQAKDYATAETLLNQAVAMDKTSDSLMALGLLYTGAKRYPDALQAFSDATTKYPDAYLSWYQTGRVTGFARSGYEAGVAALKRYLAVDELPDTLPAKAWAHFRLGNLYEYQGQKDLARAEYQAADSLHGDDDDLHKQVSKALEGLR